MTRHVTITLTERQAEETFSYLYTALTYATPGKRRYLLATTRALRQALLELRQK